MLTLISRHARVAASRPCLWVASQLGQERAVLIVQLGRHPARGAHTLARRACYVTLVLFIHALLCGANR